MRKFYTVAVVVATTAWVLAAAPAPAASAAENEACGSAGDPIVVPVSLHAGRLVLPIDGPGGHGVEFGLSLGSVTVVSESLAAHAADGVELLLGGIPVPIADAPAIPDDRLLFDGKQLHGLIGPDMLNDFDVLLDVPGERMVLKEIGREVSWPDMELSDPVRLQVYHGRVFAMMAELNGTEYRATLELGAPALIVNPAVKEQLGLGESAAATLRVAGAAQPGLPVVVQESEILERWDPDGAGFVIVGAPIAYDCAIAVSWVHREMRTCVR